MTARHCSACSSSSHTRPTCPRVHGCIPPARVHPYYTETIALREDMQLCFDFRRPRPAADAFAALRDRWGEINERRLWRVLRWLEARRRVAVVGAQVANGHRYASDGYIRRAA